MQEDAYRRVRHELLAAQKRFRAFEDAYHAERLLELGRQGQLTGSAFRDSIARADELAGQARGLAQAHELIASQLSELASAHRQERLMSRGRPRSEGR